MLCRRSGESRDGRGHRSLPWPLTLAVGIQLPEEAGIQLPEEAGTGRAIAQQVRCHETRCIPGSQPVRLLVRPFDETA